MTSTEHPIGTGRFLTLVAQHGWEFVRRRSGPAVVGIVAVTPADEVLLVEQHRLPVAARVIELPAGLVGDETAGEEVLAAAARELEEETGWRAGQLRVLARGPSSAGLTDEIVTLVRATALTRTGAGGGVAGEAITVHRVPRRGIAAWLHERAAQGVLIDHKVQAGLWWLAQEPPEPTGTRTGA